MQIENILILLGIILIVIGILLKINLKIFPLPGDILIQKDNFIFYFPIVSSLVLSIIISLIIWLFTKK